MASPRKSQSEKFLLVGLKNYYDDNKNHNLPNSRLSLGENKGICGAIVNYAHLSQNIANTDLALTRIDYRLNARNQFSGHYIFRTKTCVDHPCGLTLAIFRFRNGIRMFRFSI